MNYYNEIDDYAANQLDYLIATKQIPYGFVDRRSIEDVKPNDLKEFKQCHFFAGIGGWSLALKLAGWPDDKQIWTGSCPCQPFSAAGKGAGFTDKRHLWPSWYHLIDQCRPPVIFGEQVASKAVDDWIDLVQSDMEAVDYGFGSIPFPAASVGSPMPRERTYWVAHAYSAIKQSYVREKQNDFAENFRRGATMRSFRHLADEYKSEHEKLGRFVDPATYHTAWSDCDWIRGRDGFWRPVEPGTFPLANGVSKRLDKLRVYGNAIVAQAGAEFIGAYISSLEKLSLITMG